MPLTTPPTPRLGTIPLPDVSAHYPPWSNAAGIPPPTTTPIIQLHEILRPSSPRRLYYDFISPPTTIIFHDKRYTRSTLTMAATNPPVTYFRVMLPTTPPLPVMVHNLGGVTVFDVLNSIYHSLHAPAGPSVWDELDRPHLTTPPPTPPRCRSIDIQHSLHATGSSSSPPEGKRKIDRLRGRTSFVGLLPGPDGPESWNLHTTN